jgi:two-component system chemotaxis response regulator CheB
VIGTARDGVEALRLVEQLKPDVVTLDVELPEIDGVTCVAYIMKEFPTPIVMVTGFSEFMGEETIRALEYGAVGLVRKPKGGLHQENLARIACELMAEVRLAAQVNMSRLEPIPTREPDQSGTKPLLRTTNKIVAIASSSGGPRALSQVIPRLPADLPAAVLVVQHIPEEFVPSLAARLNAQSALLVKVAEDGETIRQGTALIAPGRAHCRLKTVAGRGEVVELITPPEGERFRLISADVAMTSLAPIYGGNATGVVLTGMGNDGTEGLRAIKEHGGATIAEHESTCVVYGMPQQAVKEGVVDEVVPLPEVADAIVRTVARRT